MDTICSDVACVVYESHESHGWHGFGTVLAASSPILENPEGPSAGFRRDYLGVGRASVPDRAPVRLQSDTQIIEVIHSVRGVTCAPRCFGLT